MLINDKLAMLSAAAKYDVSCSTGSSSRHGPAVSGVCHSWTADGRCVSLLKVLLSNACIYDCAYCNNRRSIDSAKASFTPHELATLTNEFYRRNYIDGLFLSSGIVKSPDYTMEQMLEVVRLLRAQSFGGYIHLKAIPGASPILLHKAGFLVDRMSVNIELPSEQSLSRLAPDKNKTDILGTMAGIRNTSAELTGDKIKGRRSFIPSGQSTQLIVGATEEDDATILKLSSALYQKYGLRRVFYSAFMAVTGDKRLPTADTPLLREHRLYQADWLYRFYGFNHNEILNKGNLETDLDPKAAWASRNPQYFPVDVMTAGEAELLRVPGIGLTSA
ncbi:MAG: putative DNA modification/repair radical SAM protein, partial [Spirochaetaceae bacterium]|nr:putative DNA modification/repair radical SAM protein [Spirochaetaceae bacterium]